EARAWYPVDDPVHGFDHVERVYRTAEVLADEVGADLEIVRAAALLHDVEGAAPHEGDGRSSHEITSAENARRRLKSEGWQPERIEAVLHCIRAHRYRGQEQPQSLEAQVLFDADKLDVLGAFGVARTVAYAVQAGQPVYAPPSERFLERGERDPDEPHSAYHEYLFKLRKVRDRLQTDPAKRLADRRERLLHDFFQQLSQEAEFADLTDLFPPH
ncbi:MAG: HD domain-containing protein, partial [Anaerolineales bacterium]|nr:HD domain-containing protein [Anaerolineales bacterium]